MRHADGYAYRVSDSNGYGYGDGYSDGAGYSYAYRDTFGDPDVRAGRRTDNNTLRLE